MPACSDCSNSCSFLNFPPLIQITLLFFPYKSDPLTERYVVKVTLYGKGLDHLRGGGQSTYTPKNFDLLTFFVWVRKNVRIFFERVSTF